MRNTGLAILSLFLASCMTIPNVSPPPIEVPHGLNENDVELAVVMAVAARPAPPNLTPGQQITDNVLSTVIRARIDPRYRGVGERGPMWYFEDRGPRVVYAGFQYRELYMRVAVRYDASKVTMTIVESRNLKQDESSIHKRAFAYLQGFENRVRRALGDLASRNLGADQLPEKPIPAPSTEPSTPNSL